MKPGAAVARMAWFAAFVLGMPVAWTRPAAAQETGAIAGRVVVDETLAPVAGAQVFIVGSTFATLTDEAGRYRIEGVPSGVHQLRVLMIGYAQATERVTVAPGTVQNAEIRIAVSAVSLDGLVVTATGRQRRRELANSVSDIQAGEVAAVAPVTDVSSLITGRAAGVLVSSSAGVTGSGTRIRIRGASSVSLNNAPLIYVDGARVSSDETGSTLNVGGQSISRLNDLNPENIASIEIVKGPSAATLYGTQAANGVIRITTKRGRAGAGAHVWMEAGLVRDVNEYPGIWRSVAADGTHCPLIDVSLGRCQQSEVQYFNLLRDAQSTPFRTGSRTALGASVSGASAPFNYFLSAESEQEAGTLPNNEYERLSLRANIGAVPVENLNLQVSTGFITSHLRLPNNDNSSLGIQAQGLLGSEPAADGWWRFSPTQLFKIQTLQDIRRLTGSSSATWDPLDWLSVHGSAGLDIVNQEDTQFIPPGEIARGREILGVREANRLRGESYTAEFGATASFDLMPGLNSQTSVGAQFFHERQTGTLGRGEQLVAGTNSLAAAATTTVSEFTIESKTLGAYVQEQIGIADRLFFTAGLRGDDNSAFGEEFDVVIYPKVGSSWVVSEESFFPDMDQISSLRIRAAYGQSGNQPGVTDALLFMTGVPVTTSDLENAIGVTFEGGGLGNPNLRPERSAEIEGGFDANLWAGRLNLNFTFYRKSTQDALIFRDVAPSVGKVDGRWENLGETRNVGFEFGIDGLLVDTEAVRATLVLMASKNDNELVELGEGVAPIAVSGGVRHTEGFPLGSHWDFPILSYEDANGDGIIEPDEVAVGDTAVFLGASIPTRNLSIQPTLSLFGRITLTGVLEYRGGHLTENSTASFRCARANDRARNDPDASLFEQARCVASFFKDTDAGYIESGAFAKLREISVTLIAPDSWASRMGASRLRFTMSGRNLATWTDYTGVDPEITRYGGSNFGTAEFLTQGPSRYWTARVNVSF